MMNRIKMIFVAAIVLVAFSVNAQKEFKGKITYKISYTSTEEISPAKRASMPNERVLKVMGGKYKEESVVNGVPYTIISNGENMTYVLLLNVSGKKIAVKQTEDDILTLHEEIKAPEIEYQDEVKNIAGYECKKAIVTIFDEYDEGTPMEVYYSAELANEKINFMEPFRGLKGMPMEFSKKMDEISIKYEAILVKKGKVKSIDFLMPEGYETLSEEDIKEMGKSLTK